MGEIKKERLPLFGIRVADFTHMVAGPYGTLQLAYFGAEVIKLESTVRPDTWRIREGNEDIEQSRPFADHNRNKLSVTINLKSKEGRDLARRLIQISDVVVENFSASVMGRLGLDYESIKRVKPDIIMASLQGLGRTGPRKGYVTWGPSLMPYSGMTYLWNEPNAPIPVGSQTSYPDYIVSLHMAFAVMAALRYREKTGEGQHIDISQAEVTASLIGSALLDYLVNKRVSEPLGNHSLSRVPHGCYRCQGEDQWCVISVADDEEWSRFCRLIGDPSKADDPRFDTLQKRLKNREELDSYVQQWTLHLAPEEVMEKLQSVGISAGVVHNGARLANDRHLWSRGSIQIHEHPRQGKLNLPGVAMKLSDTPGMVVRHAPLLGQDNDYVFRHLLGLSEEEIQRLQEAGAF
ncbi:MAG: CaiB/BaiF CoA transferase family protein [Candidatus Binatia bacterium]